MHKTMINLLMMQSLCQRVAVDWRRSVFKAFTNLHCDKAAFRWRETTNSTKSMKTYPSSRR